MLLATVAPQSGGNDLLTTHYGDTANLSRANLAKTANCFRVPGTPRAGSHESRIEASRYIPQDTEQQGVESIAPARGASGAVGWTCVSEGMIEVLKEGLSTLGMRPEAQNAGPEREGRGSLGGLARDWQRRA